MIPGPMWMVDIILATIGSMFALALFVFYSRLARERTSRFTLGLAVFSLVFLIQNLAAALFYFRFASTYSADVALPLMALHTMELVGMGAMLWLASQ